MKAQVPASGGLALALLGAAVLPACGYSQDRFSEDLASAKCTLYAECEVLEALDFDTVEECAEDLSPLQAPEARECAAYDRDAARQCVEGVEQMTCEDLTLQAFPDACGTAAWCGQ